MRRFSALRRMISTFDVGIAWLPEGEFWECKSPLRALQYGAAGVPVAASSRVYRDVLVEDDQSYGMIAETPEALAAAVEVLLKDEGLRRDLAQRWRMRVFRRWTYEMRWRDWLDAYGTLSEDRRPDAAM